MSFDPKTARIYLACGEGVITTVQEADATHFSRRHDAPTAEGARNSLFVPELETFYVAIPKQPHGPAALQSCRAHE